MTSIDEHLYAMIDIAVLWRTIPVYW